MKSAINDLQDGVNAQSSQASTPDRGQFPTEAVEVVTSPSTQVGVARTAKRVEGERNVTTVLLVVALAM